MASAQNNYVFKGDHGYHQQSFNLGGGGASSVVSSGRRGGYSGVSRGAAIGGNVQLVALVPVQAQRSNYQARASSVQSSGPVYAAVQVILS